MLFATSVGFSQKIKNGVVAIDNDYICEFVDDKMTEYSFSLRDSANNVNVYFKWVDWGENDYYEAYYEEDLESILFETEDTGIEHNKRFVKLLYKTGVLDTNGISRAKLNEFARKNGKEFTRRRNQDN